MSADYPLAEEHFVPRSFMFDSNSHAALVLHKTAGDATPQAIYNTFLASGNPGKSVHYGVGQDGSIWQYVPEALGAGGNCCLEPGHDPFWDQFGGVNLNTVTLSIEHCDPATDNSTPLTPAQKNASFKLVAYLTKKYNIPTSHIKTHASLDPQSRARCPGNYPFAELITFIQQGGKTLMGVPKGWSDDGKTLTAPNGVPVVRGFREFILASSWDAANWPLAPESARPALEDANPAIGAGTYQLFRMSMLEWTQDRGVFVAWVGQELLKTRQELDAAKSAQPAPAVDTSALIKAIEAIPDAISPAVAQALIEARKL